jgi:lactobin A/cerein 7B family class IIb bacteriocin
MISNIADRTDARILSNDEIDDVAGGCAPVVGFLIGAAAVAAGVGAYVAYNAIRDSQQGIGTAASSDHSSYEPREAQTLE